DGVEIGTAVEKQVDRLEGGHRELSAELGCAIGVRLADRDQFCVRVVVRGLGEDPAADAAADDRDAGIPNGQYYSVFGLSNMLEDTTNYVRSRPDPSHGETRS